ncbi:hypothetical protein L6164_014332 [Bauhinia variegata]|uniref:Uncharacterized protein n=1 Tax=Bauhinia variegata TaxID=167791 RepID=A0ACB9NIA4_BAUVA|nr:hypothetical protein L6164_014332 [Bauhinia variegata]
MVIEVADVDESTIVDFPSLTPGLGNLLVEAENNQLNFPHRSSGEKNSSRLLSSEYLDYLNLISVAIISSTAIQYSIHLGAEKVVIEGTGQCFNVIFKGDL